MQGDEGDARVTSVYFVSQFPLCSECASVCVFTLSVKGRRGVSVLCWRDVTV